MIKVLYISHIYVVPFNLRKVQVLARHPDLEIEVVTANRWKDYPLREVFFREAPGIDFPVYPLPVVFPGRHMWHYYAPLQLLRIASRFRPDIIHVEEEPGSAAVWQAILLKRLFGSKILGFTWENIRRKRSPWITLAEQLSLEQVDAMIVGNKEAVNVVRQKGFNGGVGLFPQSGVSLDIFCPRRNEELRAKLGLKKWTIGFIGRLEERKGVFTLLEAAAKLGIECDLLFVGSGPIREKMVDYAKRIGSRANPVFVDTVAMEDVPAYLNCMDALVLPSLTTPNWKEQFGRVLIEAMACGVPVIGSDSGAIPEVIDQAGLIFHEGDATDLQGKLQALTEDLELRSELSRRGRDRVMEFYSEERIGDRTYEIYRRLIDLPARDFI